MNPGFRGIPGLAGQMADLFAGIAPRIGDVMFAVPTHGTVHLDYMMSLLRSLSRSCRSWMLPAHHVEVWLASRVERELGIAVGILNRLVGLEATIALWRFVEVAASKIVHARPGFRCTKMGQLMDHEIRKGLMGYGACLRADVDRASRKVCPVDHFVA